MFKQVTLKNFRTHKSTSIELYPVTLLIGNNNSGKTNLLLGIQHFSRLIRRGKPGNTDKSVSSRDLFPHRYRLAADDEPINFSIEWTHLNGEITYEISLYKSDKVQGGAACQEKISIKSSSLEIPKEVTSGYDTPTNILELREKIQFNTLTKSEIDLANLFFGSFASTFSYHFQPAFLKGLVKEKLRNDHYDSENSDIGNDPNRRIKIPAELGENGGNLQVILNYIKGHEQRTFSLFIAKMRTLDASFQGIRYSNRRSSLIWEFDLGRKGSVEEFTPDVVSDGFMKIAAISLLASLSRPPAMIMLEEIENGINPGNIQQLMHWIWQATSPSKDFESQFILTSHSPSVLREFNHYPDHVYTVRLDKRSRQSDVRNLNTSLDTLVGIGTIKDDDVEYTNDENNGKQLVIIPKYQLAELWYSGTIG